jgi:FkbM family methyltransferase
MKSFHSLASYIKSLVLFPIYVKRLYDQRRAVNLSNPRPQNALEEKHNAIRNDFLHCNARTIGEVLQIDGIKVFLHPPRVIETIHEVIIRGDYEFFGDPGQCVMIDIGMNVALATLACANNPKFTRIYAFEPLKPTYDIATQNIELNPNLKSKIETYNFGLSDVNQQLSVKFSFDEIMSISSEGTFDECINTNAKTEIIETRRTSEVLRPLFERHRENTIFLKMDCEGAEFKIVKDLEESGLLGAVDVLVIEWHRQDPDDILRRLTRAGFFCFQQKLNVEWNVGMIKAVRMHGMKHPQSSSAITVEDK